MLMLSVHYVQYPDFCFAECRYDQCCYAECRGALVDACVLAG